VTTVSILDRAAQIADRVAAPAALEVDRDARFPHEAVDALKAEGLLSALVPVEFGGEGASITEIARAVEVLGSACASTSMIFAMHQIQVACLIRHGRSAAMHKLTRELVESQLLLASATTEIGIGGDVKSSSCAVESDGTSFTLEKNAPVISYGAYADAIFATARRAPDATPGDQVLAVCRSSDTTLEPNGEWNTLGFRGTCSPGFMLRAKGSLEQILDDSYGDISTRTMLPVSHTLWAAVWLGIATAATAKARSYVQASARKSPGITPPGALRLAELAVVLQQFRSLARMAAQTFDYADEVVLTSMGFAIDMNTVKLAASELVIDIVGRAMVITGIAGYREDSPYSVGRHLRDAHGAQVMINNDRILANNAQLMLVHRG
jgi:acyl-CoA dehydrogenase